MTDESFDHFITHRRRELGLSLGDVAQALDVSPITVSNWSNGYSLPDSAQLRGLADLLDLPLKDLSDMSGVPIWEGAETDLVPEEFPEAGGEPVAESAAPDSADATRRVQLAPADVITPLGEESAEEWMSEEIDSSVSAGVEGWGDSEAAEPVTDDVGLPTIEVVPGVASELSAETDAPVSVLTPARGRDEFEDFLAPPMLEPTYVEDNQLLWRYRIRWIITAVILVIMLMVLDWAVGNMWDTLRSGVESVVPGS
jgi:transcriptional regulator with XRE-family HTH domain